MGRRLLLALGAALLLAAGWGAIHPPAPLEPAADLFEHLSVARHLARGEGFLCDMVYPLSFAFPFARHLPQPLIQRPPGYAVVLTPCVLAAGGDPAATLPWVRRLDLLLLFLIGLAGALAALRAGRAEAILPWLLLLLFSPLLAMAASWGQTEVPAALLLALLWWRWRGPVRDQEPAEALGAARRGPAARAAIVDGALGAAVALVRADLIWLPLFWWLARGRARTRGRRAAVAAAGAWLVVMAPWAARNVAVTGSPVFSLQMHGEQLKETPAWPADTIYRSLSPESVWTTVTRRPGLVAAKTADGLRYFTLRLRRWLPWPLWIAGAALLLRPARSAAARRRDRPLLLLLATAGLLIVEYSVLSHTVRYLCVLLPALALEIWLEAAAWLREVRPAWGGARRAAVLAVAALALQALAPARMPGWEQAREAAAAAQPATARAAAGLRDDPPGPLFTDNAELLWLTGRSGAMVPLNADVEARLRASVPPLADAQVVR